MFIKENNEQFIIASITVIMLWIHSVYLLGGTIFRKRQWILTSALLVFINIIVTWIITSVFDIKEFDKLPTNEIHLILYIIPFFLVTL